MTTNEPTQGSKKSPTDDEQSTTTRRTFLGAAAATTALPPMLSEASAAAAEGDVSIETEDGVETEAKAEISTAVSKARREYSGRVTIGAHDGRAVLYVEQGGGDADDYALAGIEMDPTTAERVAHDLVKFAQWVREDEGYSYP